MRILYILLFVLSSICIHGEGAARNDLPLPTESQMDQGTIKEGIAVNVAHAGVSAGDVLASIHKAKLIQEIYPLLLSKEQIHSLLEVLSKVHRRVKATEEAESRALKAIYPQFSRALTEAEKKRTVPSDELLQQATGILAHLKTARLKAIEENITLSLPAFEKIFQAWQKKAIEENIVAPQTLPLSKNLSGKEKLIYFYKTVLLDPMAYSILQELARLDK